LFLFPPDYLKTATAIARRIGILTELDSEDKTVDCEKLRELASSIEKLENSLKPENSRALNAAERSQLALQLLAVQSQLDALVDHAQVYARAQPSDKLTIVKALQRMGHVCCMTGDGVNGSHRPPPLLFPCAVSLTFQFFLCIVSV
jgi:magnesium-transporting ATPase (P-type)